MGRVYKFVCSTIDFKEFYTEATLGLYIANAVMGAIGVLRVCPINFCLKMEYAGPSLDMVLG